MSITVKPITAEKGIDFGRIVAFHASNQPSVFYQEILVPFLLMRMTVQADCPADSMLSFYTSDTQFSAQSGDFIQGRPANSQHQHNCFEFTYVMEGNMYQLVEGKRYFYPTGSCCLMNRNTLHTEELSTDFSCIFFCVSTEFVTTLLQYAENSLFRREMALQKSLIFQFFNDNLDQNAGDMKDFLDFVPRITETEQVEIAHALFKKMLQIVGMPSYGTTCHLFGLFLELIGILSNDEYYNAVHVTTKSNVDSLLFARIDQILNESHGRISNSVLAQTLNYNGSYLGRIVKKYTGKSLFDYSMTFTMAKAVELLVHTDMSATEIAAALQFTNRSHFYRLFKASFGITPKEYRRQNRALV